MHKLILFLSIFVFSPFTNAQQSLRADHVEVQLITSTTENENQFNVGVHFKIDPDWHIYWKNPGDSGAAPKFNLEDGTISKIDWPYPSRIPVGHLTNYGYDHEVVFPLLIQNHTKEIIKDALKGENR